MIRTLLETFPTWGVMTLVVGALVALAVVAFYAAQRYATHLASAENNEIAGVLIGILGGVYGIILGFVIVSLWEGFNRAADTVSAEASSFAQIVRDADAFPEQPRARITAAVGEYVRAVREDEWALMRAGESSPRAAQAVDGIFAAVRSYEPEGAVAQTFYTEAVARLNDGLAARRERLNALEPSIPGSLLFMLFSGAIVIIGLMAVMGSRNRRAHLLMMSAVTGIIAFNLVLGITLDYPFSGDISVSDGPFRIGVLQQFR